MMPDPKQLPYLLKLLDDESEAVRDSVIRELNAYGNRLDGELRKLGDVVTESQREFIRALREDHTRRVFDDEWKKWRALPDDNERLENALSILSEYVSGPSEQNLSAHLDALAEEFHIWYTKADPHSLSHFLFERKKFQGTQENYYDPRNSSLTWVLARRKGIPISLSCIYILLGRRLGLDIGGINFPGHFLALAREGKEMFIVDCFYGGRILDKKDVESFEPTAKVTFEDILKLEATPEMIVERTLRNLYNAYERSKDKKNRKFIGGLLEEFKRTGNEDPSGDDEPDR